MLSNDYQNLYSATSGSPIWKPIKLCSDNKHIPLNNGYLTLSKTYFFPNATIF